LLFDCRKLNSCHRYVPRIVITLIGNLNIFTLNNSTTAGAGNFRAGARTTMQFPHPTITSIYRGNKQCQSGRDVTSPPASSSFSSYFWLKVFLSKGGKKSKRLTCDQHVRGVSLLRACLFSSGHVEGMDWMQPGSQVGNHLRHRAKNFPDASHRQKLCKK